MFFFQSLHSRRFQKFTSLGQRVDDSDGSGEIVLDSRNQHNNVVSSKYASGCGGDTRDISAPSGVRGEGYRFPEVIKP